MKRAVWILIGAALGVGLSGDIAGAEADPVEAARLAVRTKQFSRAVELLRAPANRERVEARYLLGLALWSGVGIPLDRMGAMEHLRYAAQQDHGAAAYALAAALATGTPTERAEAARWRARALAAGYSPALDSRQPDALPLADPRGIVSSTELRYEIARFAARHDDENLLRATDPGELVARRGSFGRTLLAEAAEAAALQAVQTLIAAGAKADVADEAGITPLMLAAASADARVTQRLLAAGATVDAADGIGRTPLMRAAAANQAQQIRVLLTAGATLARVDSQGYSATDIAAQRGAADALQALRAAGGVVSRSFVPANDGIDPSRGGLLYQGWPPLMVAITRNDVAEIRGRLAAGDRLDLRTPQGASALRVAVESGAAAAAAALLAAGADPRRPDGDGLSAWSRVVREGDLPTFEAFFGAPAATAASPDRGEMAALLAIAIARREPVMVRGLLSRGADPRAADAAGRTALHVAARAGDLEIIKLLLARGGDAALLDVRGRSALWYAVAARRPDTVALLLAAEGTAVAADQDGTTPLMLAAQSGDGAILSLLLAADHTRDPAGRAAALRVAAGLGHAQLVDQLLTPPVTLDSVDAFGDTALMGAARAGHADVCMKLLAAGANPRLRNPNRATAADLAESRGFRELALRLKP